MTTVIVRAGDGGGEDLPSLVVGDDGSVEQSPNDNPNGPAGKTHSIVWLCLSGEEMGRFLFFCGVGGD